MSAHASPSSPITEFLGQDASAGGPFALLGLLHSIENDEQIIRACHRRLHQVDHHRQRSTPDADEVRRAIHAAGSQLLDPALRAQLALRWPQGVPVAVPSAWKPKARTRRISKPLIDRAMLLIGASGGWNSTARTRLAHFARVNRITALELVSALSPARPAELNKPSRLEDSRDPLVSLIEPPESTSAHWLGAYALLILMGLAVSGMFVLAPPGAMNKTTDSNASPAAVADAGDGSDRSPSTTNNSNSTINGFDPIERDTLRHYTAIAHELDTLARHSTADQAPRIERFKEVYPQFVRSWIAFPDPALDRSVLNIVDFVRQIGPTLTTEQAVDDLLGSGLNTNDRSNPVILLIHLAVLDATLTDRRLEATARESIIAARRSWSGYDPMPGASVFDAMTSIAGLLAVDTRTDDPQWWGRWIEGVERATADRVNQRTKLVLSAMSARLRASAPADDAWSQSSILLVNTLTWRAKSEEQLWVLRQFADQAVNTTRLAQLTNALAVHSSAQEITAQMVLNPNATFRQRQELASDYRQTWNPAQAPGSRQAAIGSVNQQLVDELRIAISITPTKMDTPDAHNSLFRLARLNTADWLYIDGQDTQSSLLLEQAEDGLIAPPAQDQEDLRMTQQDIQWANSAMNAQNTPELASLFAQLVQSDGPGINSAHALVYLAVFNSDNDFRDLALAQLRRYKDHPSVLLAVDHAVQRNRSTSRIESMVLAVVDQPLPTRTDDQWPMLVHRDLLSRLIQSRAGSSHPSTKALESELGSIYAQRVRAEQSNSLKLTSANSAISERYTQLLDTARAVLGQHTKELDQIESTLEVRLARARGPLARFNAYQRALCTLSALLIDEQIAGTATIVSDTLAELELLIENARTITEQIVYSERCLAQLWVLWLEQGRP